MQHNGFGVQGKARTCRLSTCHSRDEIDRRVIRPGQVLENQQQRIFPPIFLFSVITLFGVTLNGVNLF